MLRRLAGLALGLLAVGVLAVAPGTVPGVRAAGCVTDASGKANVTDVWYSLNGSSVNAGTTLAATGVVGGDTITVHFTVVNGCTEVTFASYTTQGSTFGTSLPQTLFSSVDMQYQPGSYSATVEVPFTVGKGPGCTNTHDQTQNGHGANVPGAYDSTCDGSPSGNGLGDGNAYGKPCAGCVGNADNKNPPGQAPNGSDPNAGYECDRNQGVGQTNPAHSGCGYPGLQIDLAVGPVLETVPPLYNQPGNMRLIDFYNA